MDFTPLERFGLKQSDLLVYKSLVHLGRSKTGDIIKETEVSSSQVYVSLERLIKKGLVSYIAKNNIRYYQAELPTTLLEESKRDAGELEVLTNAIKNLPIEKKDRNAINLFEGKDGFKKAFLDHVEQFEPGEVISIIAFTPRLTNMKELYTFLKKCNQLTLKKKCTARMLLDRRWRNALDDEYFATDFTVRFLPSGYFNPAALNISRKQVLMSVWGDKPIAIGIQNPFIIKSFEQNFNFLWQSAKPE